MTYGAAGAIAGLLSLHRARPSRRLLEIASEAGDMLIACAQPAAGGLGWPVQAAGNEALAGFSHGAAGIAWALSHLAAETGESRFRRVVAAALAFERGVFAPERGNWPDRRPLEAPVPARPSRPASAPVQEGLHLRDGWHRDVHDAPREDLARGVLVLPVEREEEAEELGPVELDGPGGGAVDVARLHARAEVPFPDGSLLLVHDLTS